MTKDFEDFLLEEIKKSGYPLEIEISSILEQNKWFVINNGYYLDKTTNKEREIDITANYPLIKGDTPKIEFLCTITLVIECKKSNTYSWVFFSRPTVIKLFSLGQYVDYVRVLAFQTEVLDHFEKNHYENFDNVASTYAEFKVKKKNKITKTEQSQKDEIFTAVNQLKNYILYDKDSTRVQFQFPFIRIYYPIIVFDGELFECTIEKGVPKLKKANHILLRYWHPEGVIFFDIVKKEFFKHFITIINTERDRFYESINLNYSKIIKDAENYEKSLKRNMHQLND